MNRWFVLLLCGVLSNPIWANKVVNVYAWGGEIPKRVIQAFERETGIHVNFSTYDSNEILYAKLRSSQHAIYDVILPSAYFVERMKKQGMLTQIEPNKLSHINNIDPRFRTHAYDLGNQYSIPLIWGATGIFYNQSLLNNPPKTWKALWDRHLQGQLMLPDDSREVLSIALMALKRSPNDHNPRHIWAAYQKLLALIPNIKLFASDGIQAMIIDEDAIVGAAWNGDAFKAQAENQTIQFIYPDDGFVIWIDCLAIPLNPPHLNEAYQFIDYMLKAQTAAHIALQEGHAITNRAGIALLPEAIQNNPNIYPSDAILKRGHVQQDISDETLALYNQYWQAFKLAF